MSVVCKTRVPRIPVDAKIFVCGESDNRYSLSVNLRKPGIVGLDRIEFFNEKYSSWAEVRDRVTNLLFEPTPTTEYED